MVAAAAAGGFKAATKGGEQCFGKVFQRWTFRCTTFKALCNEMYNATDVVQRYNCVVQH